MPQSAGRDFRDLERRCTEQGLPLTEPRRAVLKAALQLRTHPTADGVYACAIEQHPGLGRATVYRTLESFVRIGVLTKACHPGSAVRYDVRTAQHHHLVCMRCESIVDLHDEKLDALPVPDTSKLGFQVSDVQVQLRGVCRSCRQKEKKL